MRTRGTAATLFYGARDGLQGTSKGDKERVALGINLVAIVMSEGSSQQLALIGQHFGVLHMQLL